MEHKASIPQDALDEQAVKTVPNLTGAGLVRPYACQI